MHRKHSLFAKCASGLLSFSLIMSMIPSVPVWAEEEFSDDSVIEEAAFDTEPEEISSIFYITKFTGFEKDSEGHFTDEQTKEKYGELKYVPGTSLSDLKLPEDLDLEGYWESEGPDVPALLTLEDITWKLKSDTGEVYSETSPEGTYTFIPDYEAYLLQDEDLDDILLAEGVKDLTIEVTIATEEAETELSISEEGDQSLPENSDSEDPSTEFLSDEPVIDNMIPEESIPDGIFPEQESEILIPEASEDMPSEEAAEHGEINIFDSIDDSVIDPGMEEEYKDTEAPQTEAPQTEAQQTEALQTEVSITDEGVIEIPEETVQNETAAELQTEAAPVSESETEPQTEALQSETSAEMQTEATPAATLTGKLTFYNNGNDTAIFEYPTDGTDLTLTAGSSDTVVSAVLPCNATLNNLIIKLQVGSDLFTFETNGIDFSDGTEKEVKYADSTDNIYTVKLALIKSAHNFDAASCNHLSTCTNCGITTGDYAAHVSANNATCTKNATCSVCGTELANTALGHDWKPATCTTPKTCTRCQATEGAALGHELYDDWDVMEESTYSSHGYEERFCYRDDCDYTETRDLNIIGNPSHNAINNLSEGASYDVNTRLTFTAYGAATENTKPISNDVRYIPSTWSIQGTPGTWLDNFSGAFSISKPGTYTVTVTFQKQVYSDGSWKNTDTADSKSVTFTIGGASADGSNDAVRINPQTGDQTPILPFVILLAVAVILIVVVLIIRRKRK